MAAADFPDPANNAESTALEASRLETSCPSTPLEQPARGDKARERGTHQPHAELTTRDGASTYRTIVYHFAT